MAHVSYCGNCGSSLKPGSGFCGHCGKNVPERRTPQSPDHVSTPETPARRSSSSMIILGASIAVLAVVGVILALVLRGGDSPTPIAGSRTPSKPVATTPQSSAQTTTSRASSGFPSRTTGCRSGGGSSSSQPVVECVSVVARRGRITVNGRYCDRTPGYINDFTYVFAVISRGSAGELGSSTVNRSQTRACPNVSTTITGVSAPGDYYVEMTVVNHTNGRSGDGRSKAFSIR